MQDSLQAMQTKIDEANSMLVKENEAARKAIEEAPPVIKETQVFVEDTKKVDTLITEVEHLKVTFLNKLVLLAIMCIIINAISKSVESIVISYTNLLEVYSSICM